jgi:hypothetical protein
VIPLGQPLILETTLSGVDGAKGLFVLISRNETANRQLIANRYHPCQSATECRTTDEFVNLAAGQYLVRVLVQSGQATTEQAEIPITVQ